MKNRIYLSSPHMSDEGFEMSYIQNAFDQNWIAPLGENVDKFEENMCDYTRTKQAVALSSGTAAIHLGLKALDISEGDYVFCSDLTFSATCNPILYEKAIPVFIDCDESWNMSPIALQKAFDYFIMEIKKMPKAVIVVDLYGQSAKWDEIIKICSKYNVPILEDAAEALGATYKGKHCGTFGKIGVYSFNGNKIITTSGGGMAVCESLDIRDKMQFWSTQSREKEVYYQHKEVGYNYRMSNICAGIGRGQLKVLDERVKKKNDIHNAYNIELKGLPVEMMQSLENTSPTNWLSCMTIHKECKTTPLQIIKALEKENIEARHVWKPMHLQPIFKEYRYFTSHDASVSEDLFTYGVCLPSDTKLQREDIQLVCGILKEEFKKDSTDRGC